MRLEEYVETMIPIVKLVFKEKEENPSSFKNTKLWFLYRHYFYGFEEFIGNSKLMYVSENARNKFGEIRPNEDLLSQDWKDQPKFDKGRKIFNYDHVYTGGMFRSSIEELWIDEKFDIENVIKLVEDNYRIAWILKTEEKRIPKSKRGKTLLDAIKVYEKNGIILLKNEE